MIKGIGCDIVKTARFAKGFDFLCRFAKKYFTYNEINEMQSQKAFQDEKKLISIVATRFSAKEAVVKALGSGFRDGIAFKDIEIIHDDLGCPHVTLYHKALERAYLVTQNQEFCLHITLSNEQEYANTVAVLEIV